MTSNKQRRAIVIVLDACGAGPAPDSEEFGDPGADTLGHIAEAVGGLDLPNLQRLGLGATRELMGCPAPQDAVSVTGVLTEQSQGKDTTTGHWELMGVVTSSAFPTYPNGFPPEVIAPFEERTGRKTVANRPASGTGIIEELGEHHMQTGDLIVYTSADSVFQIAAHEDIVPIEKLYEYCEIAREILVGEHAVGRVIARPFIGSVGKFQRTHHRHDFALEPPGDSYATAVVDAGLPVVGVGKIFQIFAGKGISIECHTESNMHGVDVTIEQIEKMERGFVFTNLVETDMVWGHRRDPVGYHNCLREFDARLPEIESVMGPDDLLIITADHGCDPTYRGSDHTRELVPLIAHCTDGSLNGIHNGAFADVGASVCDWLEVDAHPGLIGSSFAARAHARVGGSAN